MYKTFTVTLAVLALLGANSNTLAGGSVPVVTQVVTKPGEPRLVAVGTKGHAVIVPRDTSEDAGLTVIATNLTRYKSSPYYGWYGYEAWGPQVQGADNTENWLATAFTPKTNVSATRVEVPAAFEGGTNQFILGLYDDAGGVPKKALHSWTLTDLQHSVCCAVAGVSYKPGIPLTGGKQYWIVLRTSAKAPDSAVVWQLTEFENVQKNMTSWAAYCGGPGCALLGFPDHGWHIYSPILYGLAFAVLGK